MENLLDLGRCQIEHRKSLQEVHNSLKKVQYGYYLHNPPVDFKYFVYKKKTKKFAFHGVSNGYQENPLIFGQTLIIGFEFDCSY